MSKIKLAQDFGLPPLPTGGGASDNFGLPEAPSEPAQRPIQRPVARPAQGGGSPFAAVKKLQEAILEFANVASSSDVTSMQGNQSGKQQSASGEYLGGSDPFGDFVAEHVKGEPGRGEQYVNTDVASPDRQRMGIEDTGLRGIIDTIKRIGTPGNEKGVDGIWKMRTNNALHQISQLMSTIRDLAKSMSVPIQGIDSLLKNLKDLVPNNYTDVRENEKGIIASTLADLVKEATSMFSEFRNAVLNNKHLRQYIDQKKSFVQYKQGPQNGRDTLTEEEKKVFTGAKPVPGLQLAKQQISLYDLDNMNNFSQLMQRIGRNPKDKTQVQNTLTELSKALGDNAEYVAENPTPTEPGA